MAHPNIFAADDQTFRQQVLEAKEPVLVDFWAEWCAPCRALAPTLEELADDFSGQAKIVKLDIDANPLTPAQFGIRSIPTVLIFKNGELVEQLVGRQNKAAYAERLRAHQD